MDGMFLGDVLNQPGFRAWKLQTSGDYLFFFLILFGGALIFYFIARYMKKRRTREDALKRVAAKLQALGGRGAESYVLPTLAHGGQRMAADLVAVTGDRVYVVKVYHRALEAAGTAAGARWRFYLTAKEAYEEENPLPALQQQQMLAKAILCGGGLASVPVERLIVFADRFGATRIGLQGVRCAYGIEKLRGMMRKAEKRPPIDIEKTKAALKASFD